MFANVMLFLPAVKLVVPVTESAPVLVCVTPPPAKTSKSPVIVDVSNVIALMSISETFLLETTETALLKSLPIFANVMSFLPAVKLVVPVTESVPVAVCVIPLATTFK